jgi:hypothetical protein
MQTYLGHLSELILEQLRFLRVTGLTNIALQTVSNS